MIQETLEEILANEGPTGLLENIKEKNQYDWIGIYAKKGDYLVLTVELGGVANHRVIKVGEGICGLAAKEKKTIIVGDVSKQPNYLACFPSTKSEAVVPIQRGAEVLGEIDVDSDALKKFSLKDKELLEKAANILAKYWDKLSLRTTNYEGSRS